MKSVKIAAIVLVVGAGLVGSYFTIKGSVQMPSPSVNDGNSSTTQPLSLASLAEKPFEWTATLKKFIDEAASSTLTGNNNDNPSAGSGRATSETNLTRIVAQSLFNRAKSLDQSNQQPFDAYDPKNPENQKALEDAVSSIGNPGALFDATVIDAEIKISDDNSLESKRRYMTALAEIVQFRLKEMPRFSSVDQLTSALAAGCLAPIADSIAAKLSDAYINLTADYLNIVVPRDWVAFHKDSIVHDRKGSQIFNALAHCSEDPIKGQFAAGAVSDFAKEAIDMQKTFKEKAQESGL